MELRHLEAFVEAVQRGSISRAAQQLYVTQPSLTQRVRTLEQELGQVLLVRSRQGVRLTPAGEVFLPRARAALAALRRAEIEMRELRDLQGGTLALGASASLALETVPATIGRFRQTHPGVHVALHTGSAIRVAAMLLSDEIELALVDRPLQLPDIDAQPAFEERLLPLAAPAHPLMAMGEVSPAAFGEAGVALPPTDSYEYDLVVTFFTEAGITPSVVAHTDHLASVLALISAGVAVGLVPELCARAALATGRVVTVPIDPHRLPARTIWAMQRADVPLSTAAQAFLNTLTLELTRTPARPPAPTPDADAPAHRPLRRRPYAPPAHPEPPSAPN